MTVKDQARDFDHHAPNCRVGAETLWADWQARPGLPWSESHGGFFLVSRHRDLRQACADYRTFSSAHGIALPDEDRTRHVPAEMDPPAQTKFRALIMPFLGMNEVAAMEPMVRARCEELLNAMAGETHVDVVARFAKPYPIRVSLTLFGFPLEDADRLDGLIVAMTDHRGQPEGKAAAEALAAYVETFLRRKALTAVSPSEDITSAIVLGEVDGRRLTFADQLSMTRLLLFGGFTTTTIAVAEMVRLLAERPDIHRSLAADRSLLPAAIEEFLRLAAPATYLSRKAVRDATLGGEPIKEGQRIVVSFAAANRDPAVFDDPLAFRLDRAENPHVTFGHGPHRCLGSLVAKLEMKVALEAFLDRFDRFERDPNGELGFESGETQGVNRLPVILHRTPGPRDGKDPQ